jgi:GGDEF domain-containing protein
MALAAEIRKGEGDEQILSDVLVEYVERLGSSMARDAARQGGADDEAHLRSVMTGIESKLVKQFRQMDIQDDVLARIEDKLDQRLDAIVQDIKMDFIRSTGLRSTSDAIEELTVLQTLERSVSASDELGGILQAVRRSVEAGDVDEDDFSQIYAEIERQKKLTEEREANREMPSGVLSMKNLTLFLEKEISKAVRYDLPFSALGFSVVKARYLERQPGKKLPADELLDRVLARLGQIVRDTDVVGKLRKNQMVALLPLTPLGEAKLALKRTMKLLHGEPFEMGGIPLEIKVAGSITPFQKGRTPNTETFIDALSKDLVEMATRVKNIHALL